MPVYTDIADWIGPTANRVANGMDAHIMGVVLHIQDGTEAGSEAWFHNPASQASSHFMAPKAGRLRQMVATEDRAWAEANGNRSWWSIENEGRSGEALTQDQIESCAQVLARAHRDQGVPLQLTDSPGTPGLGWHGMGGAAWGGHYGCPGDPIKAQRPAIIARAQQILAPAAPAGPDFSFPGAAAFSPTTMSLGAEWAQKALTHRGLPVLVTCRWDEQSRAACAAFQKAQGWSGSDADGAPGPQTWARLLAGFNPVTGGV